MIKCSNVTVVYPGSDGQDIRALDNLSLEVGESEFITVLGANGSGKSTLALCLAGLCDFSAGNITIDDRPFHELTGSGGIRDILGIVFQNPDDQILTNFLDREIALALENRGVSRDEMLLRVEDTLQAFGLSEYRHLLPNQLSGGQKQKLALASILVANPKYLILDETTSYLDPLERKTILSRLLSEFNRRKDQGFSILLITQFAREAVKSDRVIVLEKGAVAADAPPPVLFSESTGLLSAAGVDIPIEFRLSDIIPRASVSSELFL